MKFSKGKESRRKDGPTNLTPTSALPQPYLGPSPTQPYLTPTSALTHPLHIKSSAILVQAMQAPAQGWSTQDDGMAWGPGSKLRLAEKVARAAAESARRAATVARKGGSELACASLMASGDIADQAVRFLSGLLAEVVADEAADPPRHQLTCWG